MPDAFRVVNVTRDVVLAERVHLANTFGSRLRGLMFSPPLQDGGGLILDPCNSVHMFFMRYPIDVLFISRQGVVVGLRRSLQPWRLTSIVRGARQAIELTAGVLASSDTRIGDEIALHRREHREPLPVEGD